MPDNEKQAEERQSIRAMLGVSGFRSERASDVDTSIGRTRIDKDPFADIYPTFDNILKPNIRFDRLYDIYSESDILQACITTMRKNVHGFGYELLFLGDDIKEKDSPEALRQAARLKSFFDYTNEENNMAWVLDKCDEDFEVVGNAAIEVIRRPRTNEVAMAYYMPITDCRMCLLDEEPTKVRVVIPRDGKPTTLYVRKQFRRFVQVRAMGDVALKWFKSFGDKRYLDATTGEYKSSASQCVEVATELLWLSNSVGGQPYGLPRWVGAVTDILGRCQAQFVNYDLFDHQGIPPMLIIVENGSLTDESREDLQNLIESMRGARNFNKLGLLEAVPEVSGLDEEAHVKIRIQNMIENRNQDLLFNSFLKYSSENIRQVFRLPALYLGAVSSYSYASAFTAKTIGEEQVFSPERTMWDDVINRQFVNNSFNCDLWRYSSKGPTMAGAPDIINAIREFSNAGALSINNSIDILNNMLGLQISKLDEDWAQFPYGVMQELLRQGRLDMGSIASVIEPTSENVLITEQMPPPASVGGTNPKLQIAAIDEE